MLRSWLAGAMFASFLILTGCTVYAERPVKAFSTATGGEGFERAFWEDIQKQDWKDLRSHLAANFVYLTPSERLDRDQALRQLQQLQIQEYSIGDIATEMNKDTFVVSYTLTLRGSLQGQTLGVAPQRRMTVWQQQKSGWLAIAHSVLPPTEAR